jgi:hypothetical protein
MRVWEVAAARFLEGPVGGLPLAPISAITEAELPGVVGRMKERLGQGVPPAQVEEVWTAATVLMGLRWSQALVEQVLRGVSGMEESVTYQAIMEKGEVRANRKTLLLQGRERFGPPDQATLDAINSITDLRRLEELHVRVLKVNGWQELLA